MLSVCGSVSWQAAPLIKVRGNASSVYSSGYSPAQIRHAYGVDQINGTGAGQTIAIVDAYGSPTIQSDLATFNSQFGLSQANLTIAYPSGKPTKTDGGWALETALDVEWAHAMAPDANILLVVAKSATASNLLAAVDYATAHGAVVVSNSWGGGENSSLLAYDSHFQHSGVIYLASSGDNGTGASWPASSAAVVAVGGTTLPLDGAGNRTGAETAWNGSGGGLSAYVAEPAYQSSYGISSGGKRAIPDVAAVADPNTGVAVYSSTRYNGQKGWFVVGGTSLSSPLWAGFIALADQGRGTALTDGHSALYNLATGSSYGTDYHDVQSGTNGTCGAICTAGPGYDEVTGLGTPAVNQLVPGLVSQP
jgi:subtilase family serine protease